MHVNCCSSKVRARVEWRLVGTDIKKKKKKNTGVLGWFTSAFARSCDTHGGASIELWLILSPSSLSPPRSACMTSANDIVPFSCPLELALWKLVLLPNAPECDLSVHSAHWSVSVNAKFTQNEPRMLQCSPLSRRACGRPLGSLPPEVWRPLSGQFRTKDLIENKYSCLQLRLRLHRCLYNDCNTNSKTQFQFRVQ